MKRSTAWFAICAKRSRRAMRNDITKRTAAIAWPILVAVLITYSNIVRKGFYPVIVVSQVIPKISIAPLFIVGFGTGTMSSLLLAFLIAFFPMTINSAMGLQTIDEDIHKMARTF